MAFKVYKNKFIDGFLNLTFITLSLSLSLSLSLFFLFLLSKKQNEKLDYDNIIETVFRKKLETTQLELSKLTIEELTIVKSIFKEEKIYYDFLH